MNRLHTLMRINRSNSGYIAILLCICIPVLLLGVKHVIDTASFQTTMLTKSSGKLYKKCAKEAVLEVAKKWNSGLTLKEQKESMLRIADEVYNSSPTYHDSVVGQSIPGLDVIDIKAERGKMYDPLSVRYTTNANADSNSRVVEYKQVAYNKQRIKYNHTDDKAIANVSLLEPYRRLYFLIKKPYAILEDPCWDFVSYTNSVGSNQNTYSFSSFYVGADQSSNIAMNYVSGTGVSSVGDFYTARVNANDDKVQLSVENDKIKVITDDDIGYAIPAECNVDIILSISTNGAACNKDNHDSSSITVGSPTVVTSDTVGINNSANLAARSDISNMRNTPIYQVAQAYRKFLHDNFKYTRGVNVGVIPYSGKLSIPPDKGTVWTEYIPKFISTYFFSDQNAYQAYIRGAFLYSTSGSKGGSLTSGYGNWGEYGASAISGGYSIMCRGKTTIEETYGKNQICIGDLLSTTNPATYKFRRMNYNPCYLGHANFLSMKCDSDCTKYYHNPYFVTELISDVEKVYDLLNAIVPINDPKNVSNFVFLPITWANNLFQSWSNDPKKDAINTVGSDISGGQLSHQSKGTSGRKKALILLVNKPDYFEHGELTYLGFNNDFSEIPLIESDCIRFDINYSDTSRKFADGTPYNGIIQGAKKILKYETTSGTLTSNTASGYYETSSAATGKLSFPQKYLIKVVLEPTIGWKNVAILSYPKSSPTAYSGGGTIHSFSYVNGKFFAVCEAGYILTSVDGKNWTNYTSELVSLRGSTDWNYIWTPICCNNGRYIISGCRGRISVSNDGQAWGAPESMLVSLYNNGSDIRGGCNINGKIIMATRYGALSTTTNGGITWSVPKKVLEPLYTSGGEIWSLCVGASKIIACADRGYISISKDNGNTWSSPSAALVPLYQRGGYVRAIGYGDGKFLAMSNTGYLSMSSDGETWAAPTKAIDKNNIECLAYGDNKFVVLSGDGYVYTENKNGLFQFTNISSYSNVGVTSNIYEPTARQEFYIEPSQISDSKDANGNYYIEFNMNNIRLISAEITNRPYKKIIPNCYLEGTTNGTGTAYISTNVKKPLTIKAKALKKGTVTFSNINNSNINNAGTNNLNQETTFAFPASNFSNNYTQQKILYSLEGATITSAILTNQVIRGCCYNPKGTDCSPLICSPSYANSPYYMPPNSSVTISFPIICGNLEIKFSRWIRCGHPNSADFSVSLNGTNFVTIKKTNTVFNPSSYIIASNGVTVISPTREALQWESSAFTITKNISEKSNHTLLMSTGDSIAGADNFPDSVIIKNSEQIDLNSDNGNRVSLNDNKINFIGKGDLHVTVQLLQGAIQYTTPLNTTVTTSVSNTDYQTITITPEEYYYEPLSDGTYKIKLDLNNVQITDPQMVDTNVVFEYTKLRLPEMTRTVDFSIKAPDGKFMYNVCKAELYGVNNYIIYANNINGDISKTGIRWNNKGYWEFYANKYSESQWNHFIPMYYTGDLFLFTCDENKNITSGLTHYNKYERTGHVQEYLGSGIYKRFSIFDSSCWTTNIGTAIYAYPFEIKNLTTLQLLMAGLTLPINTILYYGADGTTLNKYQWQMNQNNSLEIDPNIACSRVTTDACKKLKQDWGNNLRIYVIKYRKQTNYKHKVRGTVKNFDYSYIDQCASDPSYVYDVSNDQNLKDTLQSIAENIKTFAGYQGAKNVE